MVQTDDHRPARGGRGMIPGLDTPLPVLQRMPGVLQDDEFLGRFVSAFDDAYAPVFATLDSLWCYFDPAMAPPDFLDFLAGWVGIELDGSWEVDQRRAVIARAAIVHRRRGTARGIREALTLALGAEVDVQDSGGCTWSLTPGSDLPGVASPQVAVHIRTADPDGVDARRVTALLEATKPAHVAHRFIVTDLEGAS